MHVYIYIYAYIYTYIYIHIYICMNTYRLELVMGRGQYDGPEDSTAGVDSNLTGVATLNPSTQTAISTIGMSF
jgi:hypothetical protein